MSKVVKEKENVKHGWIVTCTFQLYTKSYPVEGKSFYQARVNALALFLKEFNIPGRPWEYVTTRKGVIDYTVRSMLPRKGVTESTFSETDYLRELFSKLTPEQRKESREILDSLE
jgi:hypothetical protein